MKSGKFKVTEDSRTYFYSNSKITIEGAAFLDRGVAVDDGDGPTVFDRVTTSDGWMLHIPPGWSGVSQEGDTPVSQEEVEGT